jgi:hypothetical protein
MITSTDLKAASIETTQANLKDLVSKTFPEFACLMDLLSEHPCVEGNTTLQGAVAALQAQFVGIWEAVEGVADQLDEAIEAA